MTKNITTMPIPPIQWSTSHSSNGRDGVEIRMMVAPVVVSPLKDSTSSSWGEAVHAHRFQPSVAKSRTVKRQSRPQTKPNPPRPALHGCEDQAPLALLTAWTSTDFELDQSGNSRGRHPRKQQGHRGILGGGGSTPRICSVLDSRSKDQKPQNAAAIMPSPPR